VVVRNAEPVWTPVGSFIAWRVTVGDRQTAWYDAEAPHTLVRYDDGLVTYLLSDVEWDSAEDARDAQEMRGCSAGEDHHVRRHLQGPGYPSGSEGDTQHGFILRIRHTRDHRDVRILGAGAWLADAYIRQEVGTCIVGAVSWGHPSWSPLA
jgi:hypothetical protein